MRPFNLDEYLKDPSKKVVTRDGKDARIICTDRLGDFPIIALLICKDDKGNPYEQINTYTTDGRYNICHEEKIDLFFAPEKKEGWINIYKDNHFGSTSGYIIHSSDGEAKNMIGNKKDYITTIKIEWEE